MPNEQKCSFCDDCFTIITNDDAHICGACADSIKAERDRLTAEITELRKDKPILCAECNDHVIPDDEAICGVCANTKNTIISELMAESEVLKSQAIVWHKYPEEKPEPNGYMNRMLLVTYKTDKITAVATCEYFFPMFGIECDEFGFGKLEDGIVITHWAYLPDTPKVEK